MVPATSPPFQFGSFEYVCRQVPLSLCPYVGTSEGIPPTCLARTGEIGGYQFFQVSTLLVHLVALVMTAIMIADVRSKYTAVGKIRYLRRTAKSTHGRWDRVDTRRSRHSHLPAKSKGRKEFLMFLFLFTGCTVMELLLVSNIIPMSSVAYPYFAAIHVGLIAATCWCLMLNGFVGFQFTEDGTRASLWFFGATSAAVLMVTWSIAAATLNEWPGFSRSFPWLLWIIHFLFNGTAITVYLAAQVVLVVNSLEDKWPLGTIICAALSFLLAQICLFALSTSICEQVDRLMDGLFFGTIGNLLSVMMVYKCWDDITKEDLEFAVASTYHNVWDVVGPMQVEPLGGGAFGDGQFREPEKNDDFIFTELSLPASSFRLSRAQI